MTGNHRGNQALALTLAQIFPYLGARDLTNTSTAIRIAFSTMPPADQQALRAELWPDSLPPWRRREQQRDRYRDALFALAATYVAPSGSALAEAMYRDLSRPSAAEGRRRPLVARVLAASGGAIPSTRSIRRALADVGQKNPRNWPTNSATRASD